ncbi:Phosphoheptose isomerase [Candidatus Nitrosarchaeum limnium SFB1]|jgi:D-sedoheptulose 7-phosphate isomerase|uniref:Probable phosphoheptose isomerase n=1 Tax=Candidatus Nitrosarchaeum limnium SFB1 TaxID=886738 RepID=F3KMZ5_9ARCH|nr:Phosphoheptose isomerase [Candidatus Nitrosarchaeum limnium SFB1]
MVESSNTILNSIDLSKKIEESINAIIKCFKRGNKMIIFGNGGSAADAQHIVAEFIGRFQKERKSLPAISLTTDSSIITSLANDYSYDIVFSRQCESLVSKGDIVIGISTSGKSKNVENGIKIAKKKGAITIGLLGGDGGTMKDITDISIVVPSTNTARIQEVHRVIYHIICDIVEKESTKTT